MKRFISLIYIQPLSLLAPPVGWAGGFGSIPRSSRSRTTALCLAMGLGLGVCMPAQSATQALINGEIQSMTLNNPGDHWSGGTIVVGGQNVIIPRNLLIDLPANRLTLQQIFGQAPSACVSNGESGLAKADSCNTKGAGGFATIHANHTNAGNIIAGDVLIEKGLESTSGEVTYINYDEGYFILSGKPGDPNTGVMVRINDPDGRHTVQQGKACAGGPNCSADPRFTLDGDNYTNVYTTGYPLCIPSTKPRSFTDVLDFNNNGNITENLTFQANSDGSGDMLCPTGNRPGNPLTTPVDDSRRFAPIMLGDNITAEGNFETVDGVRFFSSHTTKVMVALSTKPDDTQPDYLFPDEVGIDAAPFFNQRARTLIIGYGTLAPIDVDVWSIHYDPVTNQPHEFPLASGQGCENAAGPGTCAGVGLVGAGGNIFRIRYDVDFISQPTKDKLSPCLQLRASPRFGALDICPGGNQALANEMGVMSPIPHEVQFRTGHSGAGLYALDINGQQAPCCQYLFPFGVGLGGIGFQEFNEIDLNAMQTAFPFSGLPWNLDRRLSPGGCIDSSVPPDGIVDCEATPQPLEPFPFEGYEPRNQVNNGPRGFYNDPNYTATALADASNRVYSFVDAGLNKFNGNNTLLTWAPVDPSLQTITPTEDVPLMCSIEQAQATDSDADGVPDSLDNCTTVANGPLIPDRGMHIQRDTNNDGYGNACDPDLNNDGIVNNLDTGLFQADFSKTGNLDADFNGDHVVNNLDAGIIRSYFLKAPGPSAIAH